MPIHNFDDLEWFIDYKIDKSTYQHCSHCGMTYKEYRYKRSLGCPNCYKTFGDKLLKEMKYTQQGAFYHDRKCGFSSSFVSDNEGLPYKQETSKSWYLKTDDNTSNSIISTRLRLARNIKGYSFPHYLDSKQASSLYEYLANTFMNVYPNAKDVFVSFNLKDMDDYTKQSLVEKRLISVDFAHPYNHSFLIMRKDEQVSIMIGEEDHLRIQVLCSSENLLSAYAEAEKIALLFEEQTNIAFDENLGFLTSCTSNTGTGMRASLMIHLPFISSHPTFSSLLQKIKQLGLTIRGDHGENSESEGALFQISNQTTLGLSCEQSLKQLLNVTQQLINREKTLCAEYFNKNPKLILDKVSRSIAILKYAHLISHSECMIHTSNLRLAQYLNLVDMKNNLAETLNVLTYCMGAFSIQKDNGDILNPTERDYLRAEKIRDLMKNIQLKEINCIN